ncbi:MAG: sugar ABC transporter permease [Paracoccus denitrificans]|nr:MAG: sugar ABC transporter permease [Paracoccus denitrificans]PZO85593.1 MAG: sugar ABC transporter permease [Paracoccus denitrificans]
MQRQVNNTSGGGADARRLLEVRKHRRFSTVRAVVALVLREVQTSHGRSSGGYLWAIAEPVGGIALLTLIFSAGFRTPPLGTNFAIFYATGVVPFMAYLDMSGKVARSVGYSKALLTYPAVTFVDALVARILFNAFTQIVIATLIFSGIYWFADTRTHPQVEQIAIAMAMIICVATAIGTVNCFLFEAFAWWQQLWGILMRPIFLVSCIFFIYDNVSQPYRDWLWWNPLIHIIGQMRHAFYDNYRGDYVSYTYVFGLSLGLWALGLLLLVRYHRDLQNS